MDRLTRKELKRDRFALEFERTVDFLAEHRSQTIRISIAAAVIVVLVAGIIFYRRHQHTQRQEALTAALAIMDASVGQAGNPFTKTYATEAERDKDATKAFTDIVARYSGSDEAAVSQYYLATIAADQGRTADAEKAFREVIDSANANYASLAKMSLAELYSAQGNTAEAEKLLRSVMQKPTVFVSKEEATLKLADLLARSKPDEARKLLEPLRTERSAVSRAALTALSRLPSK